MLPKTFDEGAFYEIDVKLYEMYYEVFDPNKIETHLDYALACRFRDKLERQIDERTCQPHLNIKDQTKWVYFLALRATTKTFLDKNPHILTEMDRQ